MRPIIFNGRVWRASSGYTHDLCTTVADVLSYEVNELGNPEKMYLDRDLWYRLESVEAWKCFWACEKRGDAERYGRPESLDLKDAVIIGADGDGGFLFLSSVKYLLN